MATRKILFAAYISEENADMIQHVFMHHDLELEEVIVRESQQNDQPDDMEGAPAVMNALNVLEYGANQDGQGRCPYCFAAPCVTDDTNRQSWWASHTGDPRVNNSTAR